MRLLMGPTVQIDIQAFHLQNLMSWNKPSLQSGRRYTQESGLPVRTQTWHIVSIPLSWDKPSPSHNLHISPCTLVHRGDSSVECTSRPDSNDTVITCMIGAAYTTVLKYKSLIILQFVSVIRWQSKNTSWVALRHKMHIHMHSDTNACVCIN